MTRKELYEQIKSLGLQEEVKSTTGKHYTNVATNTLECIVTKATKLFSGGATDNTKEKFKRLIDVLYKKKILLNSEVKAILEL